MMRSSSVAVIHFAIVIGLQGYTHIHMFFVDRSWIQAPPECVKWRQELAAPRWLRYCPKNSHNSPALLSSDTGSELADSMDE